MGRDIVWTPALGVDDAKWRDLARRIGRSHLQPHAADVDGRQRYPAEAMDALHEAGITGMFLPVEYGGHGASLTAFCAVMEELAQSCASTAGVVATFQLGAMPILVSGSAEQKAEFLTALTRERREISFALSERHSGSDPASMRTMAVREGNGWLYCWYSQQCVPIPLLARQSGVPATRLRDLELGEAPTLEELAALAGPLRTDIASLRASVELARLLRPVQRHSDG